MTTTGHGQNSHNIRYLSQGDKIYSMGNPNQGWQVVTISDIGHKVAVKISDTYCKGNQICSWLCSEVQNIIPMNPPEKNNPLSTRKTFSPKMPLPDDIEHRCPVQCPLAHSVTINPYSHAAAESFETLIPQHLLSAPRSSSSSGPHAAATRDNRVIGNVLANGVKYTLYGL